MRTITVEAEVDLEDIDTEDLVQELEDIGSQVGVIELHSVKDRCKFEALKEKFYDIPEHELDEFLSKY